MSSPGLTIREMSDTRNVMSGIWNIIPLLNLVSVLDASIHRGLPTLITAVPTVLPVEIDFNATAKGKKIPGLAISREAQS